MICAVSADASVSNDDKTFVVGFSADFPPFGYVADDGQYAGFDLDVAKEVAKRNNWNSRLNQ